MSDNKEKTGFDALLDEIGVMAKAMPAEDVDKAGDDMVEDAAEEGQKGDEDEKPEGDEKPFGKSFKLKLDDGTEVDAMDGTELVKSLVQRVETNESTVLTAVTGLLGLVKSQGELIKSLMGDMGKLNSAGKGRKTVLTITDKPAPKAEDLVKSEGEQGGVSPIEFMAKCMTAHAAGKISSRHVALAEQYINSGQTPPADIVRAVLA